MNNLLLEYVKLLVEKLEEWNRFISPICFEIMRRFINDLKTKLRISFDSSANSTFSYH